MKKHKFRMPRVHGRAASLDIHDMLVRVFLLSSVVMLLASLFQL